MMFNNYDSYRKYYYKLKLDTIVSLRNEVNLTFFYDSLQSIQICTIIQYK